MLKRNCRKLSPAHQMLNIFIISICYLFRYVSFLKRNIKGFQCQQSCFTKFHENLKIFHSAQVKLYSFYFSLVEWWEI
jgi:hypothetical protein